MHLRRYQSIYRLNKLPVHDNVESQTAAIPCAMKLRIKFISGSETAMNLDVIDLMDLLPKMCQVGGLPGLRPLFVDANLHVWPAVVLRVKGDVDVIVLRVVVIGSILHDVAQVYCSREV